MISYSSRRNHKALYWRDIGACRLRDTEYVEEASLLQSWISVILGLLDWNLHHHDVREIASEGLGLFSFYELEYSLS